MAAEEEGQGYQQLRLKRGSSELLMLKAIAKHYKEPESVILAGIVGYLAHSATVAELIVSSPEIDDPVAEMHRFLLHSESAALDAITGKGFVKHYLAAMRRAHTQWSEQYWDIFPEELRSSVERSVTAWRETKKHRAALAAEARKREAIKRAERGEPIRRRRRRKQKGPDEG